MAGDLSLTEAEYALILRGHPWIRSVGPYASLSRGWAGILVELLDALDVLMADVTAAHPNASVVDFNTKSKLGTRRVFFGLAGISGPKDAVWQLLRATIERAEGRSAQACERCGAPGRLLDVHGWLFTLCDAHSAEADDRDR